MFGMKVAMTSIVAVGILLVAVQLAEPAMASTQPPVVRATIWPNLKITFYPKTFKHGAVVMRVDNLAKLTHQFTIDGVTWSSVKPHTVVAKPVDFKRRGIYSATLPDCGYLSACAPTARINPPTGFVKVT
jgi:hypothetical protein